ncbi:MAG: secretin N-terminal domain-containing protein [Candidatus Omnitrophota bacterium]
MRYLDIHRCQPQGVSLAFILILIFSLAVRPAGVGATEVKEAAPAESTQAESAPLDKLATKISLDYKDADLAAVLRSLSWTYDLNIVTDSKVKGKVTISLKDVALKEALSAILTINGLIFSEREGIIYVATGDPKAIDMDNAVVFLKYITASEALNLLRDVGSSNGGIMINETSNSLIITDFPANVAKIKDLLTQVDIAPQQVLIEAKIVDITSTDLAALGVEWTADYNPGHGLFDRGTYYAERLTANISLAEDHSTLSGDQIGITALTLKNFPVTATVDALVRQGKAKLLASPSIAVINGEEARIIIGERYPIQERTQTTTGTTETVTFVDIGTSLRVTPNINDDGYITMRIHPEVSSFASAVGSNPRITTREADTTVRVKEGETLVIGGLIKNTDNRTHDKIPVLGDIPFLGFLFSRTSKSVEQIELAVFITPKILRSRAEKLRLKKADAASEDAYVTLEKAGELSMIESIFAKARVLDQGQGVENSYKSKDFRKSQALSLYNHIIIEFPDNQRVAEAIYRAGMIHYRDFKDYELAQEAFGRLISDYPASVFAKRARNIYKKLKISEREVKDPRPVGLEVLNGG